MNENRKTKEGEEEITIKMQGRMEEEKGGEN